MTVNPTDNTADRESVSDKIKHHLYMLLDAGYGEDVALDVKVDETAEELLRIIAAQRERWQIEAVDKFRKVNHIGYAYEPGEIAGGYILLARTRKVGKNWVFKVQCLLCKTILQRGSNKFKERHIDCPNWSEAAIEQLKAEQRSKLSTNNVGEDS